MPDPQPPNPDSPTLSPASPPEGGPPASPPPGTTPPGGPPPQASTAPAAVPPRQTPVVPSRPRRRRSTLKILLFVFGGLVLVVSLVVNLVLLADVGAGLEYGGAMDTTVLESGKSSQTIALFGVEGIIDSRAVAQFQRFYKAVVGDGNVKAVVLRVNSPGGGVTSSDQICEMVKGLRAAGKKVVVSMGSMAASGGYYISAPADEIYAEATTLTGSIGVMAGWVVLKGTLDKIGAEPVIIKSTHAHGWKDSMSSFSRPHDYQRRHLRSVLDKMQLRFEQVVKTGRGRRLVTRTGTFTIPADDEDGKPSQYTETEPLNGKIYLAEEALEFGLIDGIAYQEEAVRRAAALAKLTNRRVVRYTRRRTFMEQLLDGRANAPLKLDTDLLHKLQTPRLMMIWKVD